MTLSRSNRTNLSRLIERWRSDPEVADNISAWRTIPARRAQLTPFPADLPPALVTALGANGLEALYTHQAESLRHARQGEHLVVVTGTASGKTLCYNLPVLERLLHDNQARALYLFPTKALAQDQRKALEKLTSELDPPSSIPIATYDGDTLSHWRPRIRAQARVIISNPDMLHLGVLPQHTNWAEFFQNLAFIVLDEMHAYRGVFGSHVANVVRRVKRVAGFYGASPQFILTSATIANPEDLAGQLIGEPVRAVMGDGSGAGEKYFLIYNPPIIHPELGLRRSALSEAVRLTTDLLALDVQTILFAGSRRSVELALSDLRRATPGGPEQVRGYRSGYLPARRRAIEAGLRTGRVRSVVATNALELGVDIGGMGASLLAGYPGSIAAAWQQAGRAGRGSELSLAVLVVSANPLDQFLAHHPDYFFGRSPERALINPDNPLILLRQLRCAAFELPFKQGEDFGSVPAELVAAYLQFLAEAGDLHHSGETYFWVASTYPSQEVSLRNASASRVILQAREGESWHTLGEVDIESAHWMVHPGAIYLHEARVYLTEELDLEQALARLRPVEVDYFTQPRSETEVSLIHQHNHADVPGGLKAYGELAITSQVTGYFKVDWETRQRLDALDLDMPPTELQTMGYWLSLSSHVVDQLRDMQLWSSDPNRYGANWERQRKLARQRDGFRCQVCGQPEESRAHHVHHKTPFRAFPSYELANRLDNLVTLCPGCHRRAEAVVRVRSGLSGLAYTLSHLAPLFLMCDARDLGVHADPQSPLSEGNPTVVIFERIPAGIGFSASLFERHDEIVLRAGDLVQTCDCTDGCPSCVGPPGEAGVGGKRETLAILAALQGDPAGDPAGDRPDDQANFRPPFD